jgi:hypothetical protein
MKVKIYDVLKLSLKSLLKASIIAYKKRCLKMLYVYPYIRYKILKASAEGM